MRVAVIGAGVVGLAAALHLRELGAQVRCFERAGAMSQRSAGSSRIFRFAHRTPELVSLAMQARELYREWEQRYGQPLIDSHGVVVSRANGPGWAAAMSAAGAPHHVTTGQAVPRLPTTRPPEGALVDESGGVLLAGRVGDFLTRAVGDDVIAAHVYALDDRPGGVLVRAGGGDWLADVVVICAGAATATLAAQAGLYLPLTVAHHVRFSFALRGSPERLCCWIGTSQRGLRTYQHRTAGGRWAVGAHLDPASVSWEAGPDQAAELSRTAITQYVSEELDLVDPHVTGQLHCLMYPDRGDGFEFARSGRVLAVYGENLFKFAPLLGQTLARAALEGSTPATVRDL